MRLLGEAIKAGKLSGLQELWLWSNSGGAEGVKAVVLAIAGGTTPNLMKLDLHNNDVKPNEVAWERAVPAEVLKKGWLAVARHLQS